MRPAQPVTAGQHARQHLAGTLYHANSAVTLRVYSHAITSDQGHIVAAVDRMLAG